MVAGSSALAIELRSSTVWSVTSCPSRPSSSMPPPSICQTCLSAGSRSRTDSTAAV